MLRDRRPGASRGDGAKEDEEGGGGARSAATKVREARSGGRGVREAADGEGCRRPRERGGAVAEGGGERSGGGGGEQDVEGDAPDQRGSVPVGEEGGAVECGYPFNNLVSTGKAMVPDSGFQHGEGLRTNRTKQ